MTLDPKTQFLKLQPSSADKIRAEVEQPYFQNAISFALAEFATTGVTGEQMDGAKKFIGVLLSIGDKAVDAPKFPKKRLESYEAEPEPKAK